MTKPLILLVDDEEATLRSLALTLRRQSYETLSACNGKEALDIIVDKHGTENQLDLIIFDIQMPVMTGLELVQELKAREIKLPMIAITGYTDKLSMAKLTKLDIDAIIPKPFERDHLLNTVACSLKKV